MVHVYKKSAQPLKPWNVMRSAGANNVGLGVKAKFLVLWNADVVRKGGQWHYVFDFDGRNSLEKSEIAKLMAGEGESENYAGNTDWRAFLGGDFELVTGARRTEIVRGGSDVAGTGDVKISCMRVGHTPFPLPQCA